MKKINIICVSILGAILKSIILIIFIPGLAISILFTVIIGFPPSQMKFERELRKNEEYFNNIVIFFEECGYEKLSVYRDNSDGPVVAFSSDKLEDGGFVGRIVLDVDMTKQFEYLLIKLKYRKATKENNYIAFHRWADMDTGVGILYLLNGEEPKKSEINEPMKFIKIRKFYLDNWYYYEDQYKITRGMNK